MSPSSGREAMLGRIRTALGVTGDNPHRRREVETRIERHAANLIPARAKQPHEKLLDLFAEMLKTEGADVTRLDSAGEIPKAVARYLRDHNLPSQVRTGDEPFFETLPWHDVPALERLRGRATGEDAVGLSRAAVAAAETGTLFLAAGAENPTTLNFLPDTHIAIVRAADVVGPYEEAWERLRARYGAGKMPRVVNLISGASRTADIEQTMIMGAHGPRRLHVIIVDGD